MSGIFLNPFKDEKMCSQEKGVNLKLDFYRAILGFWSFS